MTPRRRRALAALALVSLAASCRHAAPAPANADIAQPRVRADESPADAGAPVTARAPADAPDAGDPALLGFVDAIARRVSETRRLPILRPIERGAMDRAQILARLRTKVREEYPPGEILLESEVVRRLGLIPEAMDYERAVFELLEEQVAGFYDPDERRLYVASWVHGPMQEVTMAHEVTHALQDQHFDIARYTHHERGTGDAQTAAMAVVEGDATVAMMEYGLAQRGASVRQIADPDAVFAQQMGGDTSGQPRLAAAPRALREMLLFPYRYGFSMCARAYRDAGDFSRIDAMLRAAPASTEQVLHPDKLASREPPVAVPAVAPPSVAQDNVLAYDDVMGELGARLFLQAALPDGDAADGAAGWGGDRAMLFVPRATGIGANMGDAGTVIPAGALAQSFLVWVVVFDRAPQGAREDAEAAAFERGALAVLARRYPGAAARAVPGVSRAVAAGPGRLSAVARSGRTVVVIDRAPADGLAALARGALSTGGMGNGQ